MVGRQDENVIGKIYDSIEGQGLCFTDSNNGEAYLIMENREIYSFKFEGIILKVAGFYTKSGRAKIKAETIRKITGKQLIEKLKPELDGTNIDKKHTFLNTPEDKKAFERFYMRHEMTKADHEKEKFHVLDVTTNNGLYLTRKGFFDGYCFAKNGEIYSLDLDYKNRGFCEREGTRKLITPEELPDGLKIEQLKEEVRLLGEENPYIRYQPKTFLNKQEDRKLFGEFLYNYKKKISNVNATNKTVSQPNIQDLDKFAETRRKSGNTSLLKRLDEIQKNEKDVVCHKNLDVAVAEHVKSLNERREKESLKSPTPDKQ
ncbi:MAG: hypothetical protein Ta2D_02780 [Rickettsiales bacterium]|nr:MAG: hypothetical protein Ta2D_02780 [Rickettsiales bacterium]